ncbi:glutathione S-transferase family protein [Thalassobius sp. S69A]|uniref:glutathione S-transferase family protein n=1 Tax=unclassified Thalassovita TaxID=2619711 RepID=UPI003C7DC608
MDTLHWSPRSPYVRKVMVAIHEKGLTEQIETVRTLADPMYPPQDFFATNPLAKIPTLERAGQPPIWDSRVLMEWADMQSELGPCLFPADANRIQALSDEALGHGIIEVGVTLLIERNMREAARQDPRVFDVCAAKFKSALDYLEANAERLAARDFDAGHISIGVALCYLDFRFDELAWRKSRPALAVLHDGLLERPSFKATEFQDDPRPQE